MNLSQQGISFIETVEGVRLTAYQDGAGIWTIGYGHTGDVQPGDVITQAHAEFLLHGDLRTAENGVNSLVKVPLTQGQYDALVSFTYNLGVHTFGASTLLRLINASNFALASLEFPKWQHVGGKLSSGLLHRRLAEQAMFNQGGDNV